MLMWNALDWNDGIVFVQGSLLNQPIVGIDKWLLPSYIVLSTDHFWDCVSFFCRKSRNNLCKSWNVNMRIMQNSVVVAELRSVEHFWDGFCRKSRNGWCKYWNANLRIMQNCVLTFPNPSHFKMWGRLGFAKFGYEYAMACWTNVAMMNLFQNWISYRHGRGKWGFFFG